MSQKYLQQSKALSNYIDKYGYFIPKIVVKLHEATQKLSDSEMQAGPLVTAFICQQIHLIQARNILEIGTYTGYSTLAFALEISNDGKVVTCDIDKKNVEVGIPFWKESGVFSKIDLKIGDALSSMSKLENNSFDLIFIDADKEKYDDYYEESLRLVRKGGIIFIDNVLFTGQVLLDNPPDPRVPFLKKLNEKISSDDRVIQTILPISDGLTIVVKK